MPNIELLKIDKNVASSTRGLGWVGFMACQPL